MSPFSLQMSVRIPEYFSLADKNVPPAQMHHMGAS